MNLEPVKGTNAFWVFKELETLLNEYANRIEDLEKSVHELNTKVVELESKKADRKGPKRGL